QMLENADAAARGEADAMISLRAATRKYVGLLRKHIWKEDNVLFALADRVLTAGAREALVSGFDRAENSPANAGKHELFIRLADEIGGRAFRSLNPKPKSTASRAENGDHAECQCSRVRSDLEV